MSSVFGDDGGFWAGHALSERANTKQKLMLADALRQERDEKDAIISEQNNQKANEITDIRVKNLIALTEFEYEIHTRMNVSYRMRIISEKMKMFADNKDEILSLSEYLLETREIHRRKERDIWIHNRFNELVEKCAFPKNDSEAAMVGGYGMPFPGSIPPFAHADLDDIAAGETVDDIYVVLTDPEEIPKLQSVLQRGPMKF